MKRFHLSTLLVMSLLAAALLFANTRRTEVPMWSDPPENGGRLERVGSRYGWPIDFYQDVYIECDGPAWRAGGIIADGSIAISILLAGFLLCETLVQSRNTPRGT